VSHRPLTSAPWAVVVYQVSSLDRQQRILRVFHRLDRPDVVALGTQTDDASFVVVECPDATAEMHARRVVLMVDPYATAAHTTRGGSLQDAGEHRDPT
jgi:hypothetical protein